MKGITCPKCSTEISQEDFWMTDYNSKGNTAFQKLRVRCFMCQTLFECERIIVFGDYFNIKEIEEKGDEE